AVRALAPPGKYNETKFLASLVVALMEDNGENMPDDIRTAAMLYCEAALANAPEESIESVLRRILV
ncbi:MAG: hypothetical protein ACRD0K_30515, partial [Egibacteraceae bacterium]